MQKHECKEMKKVIKEAEYNDWFPMLSILCSRRKEGYWMHLGVVDPDTIPVKFCPFCGIKLLDEEQKL
jgi:hypothetical protein